MTPYSVFSVALTVNRFNPSEELDKEPAIATRDSKLGDMNKLCNLENSGHPII